MHLPELISDLAIILLTGGIVTVIFRKLNQPLVLAYILAGFLIGPYMPFFFTVADSVSIKTWSEIGVIILMFGLGLEFNLHKLISVGGTGVITALTEVSGMLLVGYAVGQALGWSSMDSLFLGGMLSMSSTTIIIKAFDDLKVRKERFAQLVFGTLVIEDIAGIFMMIILSTLSVGQAVSGAELGVKLLMLVLYLALWLLAGIYLLPTALKKASPLMSDETLLIVSLGLCFGMVLLADSLGFSSALGAFMAGSLLAGTVHAERVEHLTQGVKDLFGAVFFISVGMMLEPAMLLEHWLPIVILTLVTLVGKLFFSTLGVLLSGQSLSTAVKCGSSLAQIGEFAFIIAALGLSLGVIAEYIYPIIIAVSVITTLTTPFCINFSDRLYRAIDKLLPEKLSRKLERYTADERTGSEQDSDWAAYLGRYIKVFVLYGVIMFGIDIIGQKLLLPLLDSVLPGQMIAKLISLAAIYIGMAVFVRPMLDLTAPQYIGLWLKGSLYRLPLMALTGIRALVIVFLFFMPLNQLLGIAGLWLLPLIALAVYIIYRTGLLASAYLMVEARFLANLNERHLSRFENSGEGRIWLDEKLCVDFFLCPESAAGSSLKDLAWGQRFGVNVIKLVRGRKQLAMPAADYVPARGEKIFVLGDREKLSLLRQSLGLQPREIPTLREFILTQDEDDKPLFSYALDIEKGSELEGKSIKDSGIRENYDCMIVGLQRENLPLAQPDVNMVMQSGDLVWILGSSSMADKLLKS
jgi:CPA2 family monovalent cation:H+ antiporter-2